MITVNLLPYELRPVKRTPLPYILSGATLILAISVVAIVFVKNIADIAGATRTLNEHKAELSRLQPVVEAAASAREIGRRPCPADRRRRKGIRAGRVHRRSRPS